MARKKSTSANLSPSGHLRCTKADPIPDAKRDGRLVIHDYETTFEGAWFMTMTCKNCGHEVKAAP